MNYEHLASTFGSGVAYAYRVDGERIVTNGHIAFIAPEDFAPKAKEYKRLGELWEKHSKSTPAPIPLGKCIGDGTSIQRKIGKEIVQERFVRCFGDDVTWTAAPAPDQTLLVHRNGDLIGLVMPMKRETQVGTLWTKPATDQQVFAPYACQENGWYLIDGPMMDLRIEDAEEALNQTIERRESLEDEETLCRSELKSLRAARAAMEPVKA